MSKNVSFLKKNEIESYINFIDKVFNYEIDNLAIEKLMKKNKILIIKKEEKIIASVTLEERYEYIKNKKYYYLGYFGVLKEYRKQGYASILFDYIEKLVKENNISYIELTSGNQRRSAHYFYKSKKFEIKDTTVFVKLYE